MSQSAIRAAKHHAASFLQAAPEDITDEDLYMISDTAVAQFGNTGDREVYQYREGFYRGSAVSFGLLSVALLVRLVVPGAAFRIGSGVVSLGWKPLMFSAVVSALFSVVLFLRYQRFAVYRVTAVIAAFILLEAGVSNPRGAGVGGSGHA